MPQKQKDNSKLNFVSGPARSRRFGSVVNVNFGAPGASCGWKCVYCAYRQNGEAAPKKVKQPSAAEIQEAVAKLLQKRSEVETVILGGSSEPTTHPEFFEIVQQLLELRKLTHAKWKLICLSNGAGLEEKSVKAACSLLDQVWIKLDCADQTLFQKANRPKRSAELEEYMKAVQSLKAFNIQTTLWRYPSKSDYQNWSAENLLSLLEMYKRLKPSQIHLTTVKRKRAFEGVQPVTYDDLEAFALRVADLGINVEVFS